jgi:hypothetical protein
MTRGRLLVAASLGPVPLRVPLPEPPAAVLAASRPGVSLAGTAADLPGACLAVLDC